MPLIIPSNSISAGGFVIDNSLRFDGSSDYLNRTFGTATNRLKLTISVWLKKSDLTTGLFFTSYNSGSFRFQFYFDGSDRLGLLNVDSGTNNVELITNRVFRDLSAFYNLQAVIDTTQSTASDRVKIYVNGVQETSFSTATYPSQNADMSLGAGSYSCQLGRYGGGSDYFSGYMSEVIYLDGQTLDPTSFGEFDEDTGIWKPIDVSGLTFGNEGFYLDFENSGSLGADVSGNGNNFTVNNLTSIDQTTDTPTNNFATLNRLNFPTSNAPTFSDGNLTTTTGAGNFGGTSTLGASQGKYYAEFKFVTNNSGGMFVGITADPSEDARNNRYVGQSSLSYSYIQDGQKYNNSSGSAYGDSFTTGDIIGVAIDLDNDALYFSKNGTFQNSGDPTSGATKTGAISITSGYDYFFSLSDGSNPDTSVYSCNFGSPPYSISSGNSDGAGFGQFEYAPPSGYLALCTKNLATDG